MGNSYIGALLAIVIFGSYMVPLKKWSSYSSWSFLSMMTTGALICSLVIAVVTGTFNLNPIGLLCGVLWVAGGAFSFWAVQAEADLAGAGVRAMGVSILSSFLTGVLLFGETSDFKFSIPAIVCFLVGLSRLTPSTGGSVFKNWRSFLGGFVFGTYLIPFKIATANGLQLTDLEFMCPASIGIFVGSQVLVGILTLKRKKSFGFPMVPSLICVGTGALWVFGMHGCFWAIAPIAAGGALGYAVGYPLTQLNLLVNLCWGVVVFGEYKTAKERIKLLLATFVILAGAVLLTLSKG
ncbi:MAG: GRP family sugar transporter [Fibrobacter sp.]|nr:GRP family sugar transporter [Fibrobacter sp.]